MGTFISPSKVFAHVDRLSAWKHGEKPAPVTVEIDLSNACSLACQSCHFAHTHVAGPWASKRRDLPDGYQVTGKFADWTTLTRALDDMAYEGVQAVVWSGGGEPTLHPEFEAFVFRAERAGLQQGLYTLGGHIDGSLGEFLRSRLSWAVVSLDAPDGSSYAAEKGVHPSRFDDACAGVRALVGGSCDVGVSFLLHAKNWQRTGEMLALARSLGATYATFRPTIETSPARPSVCDADRSWVTDALPYLRSLADEPDVEVSPDRFVAYRDWNGHGYGACLGIRLVTTITPDGKVWVCPNRRGVPGSELGDLSHESFGEIWARHPGRWTDFSGCRVMCRLHAVNQVMDRIHTPMAHEAFV